jgi:predicted DNA-binding transcriptional regulator AlpA
MVRPSFRATECNMTTPTKVLRQADQARLLGVSRWTVGRIREADPTYPRERQFAPGVTGVLAHEFDNWLRTRPPIERARKQRGTILPPTDAAA